MPTSRFYLPSHQKYTLHWECAQGTLTRHTLYSYNLAQLSEPDNMDLKPIDYACLHGQLDTLKRLLEVLPKDAVNTPNLQGRTPIFSACWNDHVPCVQHLIQCGARLDFSDIIKYTVFDHVCRNGSIHCLRYFLEHNLMDANKTNLLDELPLHGAAACGQMEIAKILLPLTNNVNHRSNLEGAPLHYACKSGKSRMVELLLQSGSDPNIRDVKSSRTALHLAVKEGRLECVNLLLANGATVNVYNVYYETPLHCACNGYADVVLQLLNTGECEVNEPCAQGRTPLHIACEGNHFKVAKRLLYDGGAELSLTMRCKQGYTPEELLSTYNDSSELHKLLRGFGSENDTSSGFSAISETDISIAATDSQALPSSETASPLVSYYTLNIESCLGSGGYGRVYSAKCGLRKVAIKMLHNRENVKSLRKEIQTARGLKHPHIIEFYDLIERDGDEYGYTMELCQYSLEQRMSMQPPLTTRTVLEYAVQIVDGLHYLHRKGIAHNDLKPGNVLIDAQGNVKLCDYGAASHDRDHTREWSRTAFTLVHCAPERLAQTGYCNKADIYSFGILLNQLLTGERPFEGICSISGMVRALEVTHERPPLLEAGTVPEDVRMLIRECWSADPAKRPGLEEVMRRLRDALREMSRNEMQTKDLQNVGSI